MARANAATRARRLLSALHMLSERRRIPLGEFADSLGASPAELTADLSLLSMCGVAPYDPWALTPIGVEDGWVEMWGAPPALDAAVRLSAPEARALAAALQYAGIDPDDPLVSRLLDAAATSELDSKTELARLLRTSDEDSSISDAMMDAALALTTGKVLSIEYARTGEPPRRRDVEPLQLLCERGVWYLHAFCRDAGAPRTFRIDRIVSSAVTEDDAPKRDLKPTGRSFVAEGLPTARLRFSDPAEYDPRDWPYSSAIPDGGGIVVDVPYAGTGWISRQVVSHLGAVEVLAPDEVRDAVADYAREQASTLSAG